MSSLYIYGGSVDCEISTNKNDFIYHINTGLLKSESKCLDCLQSIHGIALNIKNDYVRYINSLNELFVKNNILFEKDISLFFFSDLFNKRTELFDTFISICHITFIKEKLLDKHKISSIKTIQCSFSFNQSISSSLKDINIDICDEKKEKDYRIKNLFVQNKFFIESVFKMFCIRLSYKKEKSKNIESLFLTRYPLHFNKNFVEDKYGDMVGINDSYLISMITDGLHQKIKLKEIKKYINDLKTKDNVIFLDRYLTAVDFLRGLFNNLILIIRAKKLYKQKYFFNGITITNFILNELEQSFIRLPRLLTFSSAIKKVFLAHRIKQSIFYLHEYSYGRFFNYILAKNFPNVKRIGFQHGPAAKRKLLYCLGENIVSDNPHDWHKKTPIPNLILAEDKMSKIIYEESGYSNIKEMNKVYRLSYLKNISRNNIDKDMILIAPGLHDGLLLLNKMKKIINQSDGKQFIFKPHPKSGQVTNDILRNMFNNVIYGNEEIPFYLNKVSEIYVTYSSVGIEAYNLGIKVNLVCLPNKINESPLLDMTPSNLLKIIW